MTATTPDVDAFQRVATAMLEADGAALAGEFYAPSLIETRGWRANAHIVERLEKQTVSKFRERFLAHNGVAVLPPHEAAIRALANHFARLVVGERDETGKANLARYAFDLPVGTGKTLLTACFLWACWELWRTRDEEDEGVRLDRPFMVGVAAELVEGLCGLKRELLDLGVPDEHVGLTHSKEPSERILPPTTGNDRRMFALSTHARVYHGSRTEGYAYWTAPDGAGPWKRDLLIWDEKLASSQARAVPLSIVDKACNYLLGAQVKGWGVRSEDVAQLEHAAAWLKGVTQLLTQEGALAAKDDARPPVVLPALSEGDAMRVKDIVDRYGDAGPTKNEDLHVLVDAAAAGKRVRVVRDSKPWIAGASAALSIITTESVVPDHFRRIAVLDATLGASELRDSTLLLPAHLTKDGRGNDVRSDFVDYSKVTLHGFRARSGKGGLIHNDHTGANRRALFREVAAVVRSLSPDERVLIYTHKATSVQGKKSVRVVVPKTELHDALVNEGIDGARVVIEEWGTHRGVNKHSDISNVILCGLLFQPLGVIAGAIAAAEGMSADLSRTRLDHVRAEECAVAAIQALGRGTCRRLSSELTPDGKRVKVQRMSAWFTFIDARFLTTIAAHFPGARITDWMVDEATQERVGIAVKKKLSLRTTAEAERISNHLQGCAGNGVFRVSLVEVRQQCCRPGISEAVWRRVKRVALEKAVGWRATKGQRDFVYSPPMTGEL